MFIKTSMRMRSSRRTSFLAPWIKSFECPFGWYHRANFRVVGIVRTYKFQYQEQKKRRVHTHLSFEVDHVKKKGLKFEDNHFNMFIQNESCSTDRRVDFLLVILGVSACVRHCLICKLLLG